MLLEFQAHSLGGLEVHHEFELDGRLDRQIAGNAGPIWLFGGTTPDRKIYLCE